jgi:hypothetical protein
MNILFEGKDSGTVHPSSHQFKQRGQMIIKEAKQKASFFWIFFFPVFIHSTAFVCMFGLKTPFLRVLFLLILTSCYTLEFQPVEDYPILKRNVKKAKFLGSPPDRYHKKIGIFVVREYAGILDDKNFVQYVERKTAEKGAEGCYLDTRQKIRTETFRTRTTGSINRPGNETTSTMQSETEILTFVLFNYMD